MIRAWLCRDSVLTLWWPCHVMHMMPVWSKSVANWFLKMSPVNIWPWAQQYFSMFLSCLHADVDQDKIKAAVWFWTPESNQRLQYCPTCSFEQNIQYYQELSHTEEYVSISKNMAILCHSEKCSGWKSLADISLWFGRGHHPVDNESRKTAFPHPSFQMKDMELGTWNSFL